MSLSGIVLGLIDIAIVLVILVLVGAIIKWVLGMLGWGPPTEVERLYLAVVALIALYMIVALLFGIPSIRFFHAAQSADQSNGIEVGRTNLPTFRFKYDPAALDIA